MSDAGMMFQGVTENVGNLDVAVGIAGSLVQGLGYVSTVTSPDKPVPRS